MAQKAINKKSVCFLACNAYPVLAGKNFNTAGGSEVQQMLLAKALQRLGYKITFIVGDYGQNDFEIVDGIEIVKFSFRFRKSLGWEAVKLILIMKKIKADIYILQVHHTFLFMMALYRKLFGGRLVKIMAIDSECRKKDLLSVKNIYIKILNMIYLLSLKFVDCIIFQTEYQEKCALEELGLRGYIVPNPVDSRDENIVTVSNELKRDIDILWVGTCLRRKRPSLFLDIAESMPEFGFTMIVAARNDIRFNEEVASRARRLPNVDYKGFVPYHETSAYFGRAKILVNTSMLEGFPNIFLQAWQAGIPVVSLDINPDDIIRRYGLGRISKTVDQLKRDVRELLNNNALREEIGKNSKKYILEHHHPDVIARKLAGIFEAIP